MRSWQLQAMLERLRRRFGAALPPLALCGDLNLLPGSPSHTLLRTGRAEFPRGAVPPSPPHRYGLELARFRPNWFGFG